MNTIRTCSESSAGGCNGRKHENDTNAVDDCWRSCAGDRLTGTADADV